MIKKRPVIFDGESVRAILARRKVMTRRLVRFPNWFDAEEIVTGTEEEPNPHATTAEDIELYITCPYGSPGNDWKEASLLWVRETWARIDPHPAIGEGPDYLPLIDTRGDPVLHAYWKRRIVFKADDPDRKVPRWRSPIYMPRWASRITLKIMGIRAERLQEITEDDAKAEGVKSRMICDPANPDTVFYSHRCPFADLWDQTNGGRASWSSNPWVWVIAFQMIAFEWIVGSRWEGINKDTAGDGIYRNP